MEREEKIDVDGRQFSIAKEPILRPRPSRDSNEAVQWVLLSIYVE